MNKNDDKGYLSTLNFQVLCSSSKVEPNEKDIFSTLKQKGNLQKKEWATDFNLERNDIVGEHELIALQGLKDF